MPLSTTRFWTPSNTISSIRWASVSRYTATPIATTGDDLRGWVKRGIMQIDPALSIHDLHEHDGFVSFDLVRPDGFDISDEELLGLVTRIVHERRPDASCVVTFDSGFSSPDRPAEQL